MFSSHLSYEISLIVSGVPRIPPNPPAPAPAPEPVPPLPFEKEVGAPILTVALLEEEDDFETPNFVK